MHSYSFEVDLVTHTQIKMLRNAMMNTMTTLVVAVDRTMMRISWEEKLFALVGGQSVAGVLGSKDCE